ncbi:MAG: methylated-DNA--[protein]-cysteine S-methyltransferase [Candidatus Sumerlaeota bacterium]|nr:methylated-DNA--[protein]-cysteine S-methyltransferase [Candidatus Sumerlaeota bacterium]
MTAPRFDYDVKKLGRFWIGVLCGDAQVRAVSLSLKTKTEARNVLRQWLIHHKGDLAAGAEAMLLAKAFAQIREYLLERRQTFDLDLDLSSGTGFQQDVWRACQTIPFGQTRPYGWIAEQIVRSSAMRAVGGALGANPIPLLVPCHRVLCSDGALGGFSCGIDIKRVLLAHESEVLRQIMP